MNISTIIGIAATLMSLGFGFYQFRQNRKIKHLRIDDALLLHKLSAQALGAIQGNNTENEMLKRLFENNNTKEKIIYDIGQSEGYCQSLLIETAKIFCGLKNITLQEVDTMIRNGQLKKNYEDIYLSFAQDKKCFLSKK